MGSFLARGANLASKLFERQPKWRGPRNTVPSYRSITLITCLSRYASWLINGRPVQQGAEKAVDGSFWARLLCACRIRRERMMTASNLPTGHGSLIEPM